MYERTNEAHDRILRRNAEERGWVSVEDATEKTNELTHTVVRLAPTEKNKDTIKGVQWHVVFSDGRVYTGSNGWSTVTRNSPYGAKILQRLGVME